MYFADLLAVEAAGTQQAKPGSAGPAGFAEEEVVADPVVATDQVVAFVRVVEAVGVFASGQVRLHSSINPGCIRAFPGFVQPAPGATAAPAPSAASGPDLQLLDFLVQLPQTAILSTASVIPGVLILSADLPAIVLASTLRFSDLSASWPPASGLAVAARCRCPADRFLAYQAAVVVGRLAAPLGTGTAEQTRWKAITRWLSFFSFSIKI